jgi:hypothetical protein
LRWFLLTQGDDPEDEYVRHERVIENATKGGKTYVRNVWTIRVNRFLEPGHNEEAQAGGAKEDLGEQECPGVLKASAAPPM